MKKTIITAVAASLMAVGLAGCAPGENTGGATIFGAATGGLVGGLASQGSPAGIILGGLVGGGLGYLIGRQMDHQDRINMSSAIVNTPVGQQATWTNPDTHITYNVEPTRVYHKRGHRCREYRTRVKIGDRWRTAYGTACYTPGVGWQIAR